MKKMEGTRLCIDWYVPVQAISISVFLYLCGLCLRLFSPLLGFISFHILKHTSGTLLRFYRRSDTFQLIRLKSVGTVKMLVG